MCFVFALLQNLPLTQINLFTMGCEGAEHDNPPTGASPCLAEACLLKSKSKAPPCDNYLTVVDFHCLELSVSTPPAKQSKKRFGSLTQIRFAAGRQKGIKLFKLTSPTLSFPERRCTDLFCLGCLVISCGPMKFHS